MQIIAQFRHYLNCLVNAIYEWTELMLQLVDG